MDTVSTGLNQQTGSSARSIYRNWFLACRPWSFTMTVVSLSVGSALAAIQGDFSWGLFFVALFGMILIHTATNLNNDYFDVRGGVDTLDTSTAQYRPHPLLEGQLEPRQVLIGSIVFYALGAVVGLYLAATRGWIVLMIGLLGALISVGYTTPPFKFKYKALGEIVGFLVWGPLIVEGAYFVQTQTLSESVFWASLPLGGLMSPILLSNNLRDLEYDKRKEILTLPILMGKQNALRLYVTLISLCYLGFLLMSLAGPLPLWSLIILISSPLPFFVIRTMFKEIPTNADARTAQIFNACGVLLVVSLVLERLL